ISNTSAVDVSIHAVSPLSGACANASAGPSAAMRPTTRRSGEEITVFIFLSPRFLKRRVAGLARADAHRMLEIEDEHLAIADRARTRGPRDGFQHLLDERVRHSRFDLRLWHEVDRVLGPAVELGMPLLSAEALDLGHRHSLNARFGQRLADVLELERLDDRRYEFHEEYLDVVVMWFSLAEADVLLDAERQLPITGLAVVGIADVQVVAPHERDGEVDTGIFHAVRVAELDVIAVELVAEAAELVVRALLRRDRHRRERVVGRRSDAVPITDGDVEREDPVTDAEVDLVVRIVEVVRVVVARVADLVGEFVAARETEIEIRLETVADVRAPGTEIETAVVRVVDAGVGRRVFLEDAAIQVLADPADVGRRFGHGGRGYHHRRKNESRDEILDFHGACYLWLREKGVRRRPHCSNRATAMRPFRTSGYAKTHRLRASYWHHAG